MPRPCSRHADAFVHQGQRGVGLNAAKFLIFHACGFQGCRNGVIQAGAPDAAASVMEQDFFAERFQEPACLMLGSFSENERRLVVINEIEHGGTGGMMNQRYVSSIPGSRLLCAPLRCGRGVRLLCRKMFSQIPFQFPSVLPELFQFFGTFLKIVRSYPSPEPVNIRQNA